MRDANQARFRVRKITLEQLLPSEVDMKEEIRRAIAVIAARKINGKTPSSIYSYERSKHSFMGASYDYEANAHFNDGYHYGTNSHMSLSVNGRNFSGYDYGSSHHFSGAVNGTSISLYDYGESRYFNYSV